MKKTILFRNLRNKSTFEFEGTVMRKISDAFSIEVNGGKERILLGRDRVEIIDKKIPVIFN